MIIYTYTLFHDWSRNFNSKNHLTEEFNIKTFAISKEPICYFSSFKFFLSFYFVHYGHAYAFASIRGNNLKYQINLYGSIKIIIV